MSRVQASIQDPPGIRAPSGVQEGGDLRVDVSSGASQLTLVIPGVGRVKIPVQNGVAEYRLPPSVRGGTVIFISDMKLPSPSAAIVQVIGNQ